MVVLTCDSSHEPLCSPVDVEELAEIGKDGLDEGLSILTGKEPVAEWVPVAL